MAIETASEIREYKNYVGGEWVSATDGETFDVVNPATEQVFARVPKFNRDDARSAIASARETFDSGVWSELAPDERSRILMQVVDKFTEHEDELAELETLQAGMTIRATSTVVIGYCINHWDYFARAADRQMQEPLDPVSFPTHSYNYVLREPIGVCAGIIPWNFPLVMAVWKLAPSLAMGNTCVLKPASNTPLTALRLAELLDETDLPKGVVNVITGGGASVGEELASHPDVDKVSFTGSTVVGRRIMQLASSTIKKCTLELGGKSPNIVYEDANLEAAVDGALWATFFHQGQVCESGTRLILPDSIHDEFVEALVERAKTIKLGDTMDYDTDMGPLVSAEQLATVTEYVRIGKEEGAKLVLGGNPAEGPDGKGYYFEPTIFTDVSNSMTIAQEEIFGPVLSVIKVADDEQAIAVANDSIYGLASAVWTEDYDRALTTAKRLKAGTVWINDHHLINCVAPFGGYKQSGIGRELGPYGLNEYTEVKHVHVDLSRDPDAKMFGVLLSEPRP
ncbi:MAG TPA: aldehyde dehydrogenase family protein [Solirubrobacteraceae bacterium]|nr:aldehyde dehydrogenase family protein [Solirubrobacteraceae bacterium]